MCVCVCAYELLMDHLCSVTYIGDNGRGSCLAPSDLGAFFYIGVVGGGGMVPPPNNERELRVGFCRSHNNSLDLNYTLLFPQQPESWLFVPHTPTTRERKETWGFTSTETIKTHEAWGG